MNITLGTQNYTDDLIYGLHCSRCRHQFASIVELSSRRGWWVTPYWSWTPYESRTLLPIALRSLLAYLKHRRFECC